jgi:hypothetical protein
VDALLVDQMEMADLPIVKLTEVNQSLGTGYAFRGYRYAEVRIKAKRTGEDHWICVDSGCGMSVVDEDWFYEQFPISHVATMQLPIWILGIGADVHHSNLYSVVKVLVLVTQKGKSVLMELELEVHLIKGLRCHMLVGNDMMTPYKMAIHFHSAILDIGDGLAQAPIRTRNVDTPILHRKVKSKSRTIVPPQSRYRIPVTFKSFQYDRDVNFTPCYH